jgi:DNA-binding NarL/FixJ family response regulator
VEVGPLVIGEAVHILVVDDFVLVELALAQVIQDTPHTLVGVRDPRNLPEALAEAQSKPFDLALVDINFGPGVPTGLTAMRILQDLSPDTKIVIESTDEERNRLLFLLASFAFFEPLGLMSKASSSEEMRTLIDAVDRGDVAGPGLIRPPGTLSAALSPVQRLVRNVGLLDELIRNGTDVILWRAVVRFDKRGEVARASHVDERTVDRFIAAKSHVVDKIQAEFPEDASMHLVPSYQDEPDEQRRHSNLVRLARFAQTHSHFFADEAIDELFTARWQAARAGGPRQRRTWR